MELHRITMSKARIMGVFLLTASLIAVLLVNAACPRGPTEDESGSRHELMDSHKTKWAIVAQQEMEARFQEEFADLFKRNLDTIEDPFYAAYEENIERFLRGHFL